LKLRFNFNNHRRYVVKKTLLVAAATLFVIGQALAQGQTPAPSGQTPNPRASQQQNQQDQQTQQTQSKQQNAADQNQQKATKKSKTAKSARSEHRHAKSSKRSSHRMAHQARQSHGALSTAQNQQTTTGFGGAQPHMQSGQFATKLTCKKGQKPDGITCM